MFADLVRLCADDDIRERADSRPSGEGHKVDREVRVPVFYKGVRIGWQRIDQLVDDKVVVETKASVKLHPTDEQQLMTYLNATRLEIGLLLHFGPTPGSIASSSPTTKRIRADPPAARGDG